MRDFSRSNWPIFSTISFVLLFLFIAFSNCVLFYHSLHSTTFTTKIHHNPQKSSIQLQNNVVKEEVEKEYSEGNNTQLVAPFNVTIKERIAWFKRSLPEFEIFKSTKLTRQFNSRVQEFLGRDCRIQFFMTWISPARSFGPRQFLALASLFQAHPQGCLIILSRTMDSKQGFRILKPLLEMGFKVLAITPDLSFLFQSTPAEAWLDGIKSGKKDPGKIPLAQNLSNLIRLAILYKFGGVYLDIDVIVLKDFSGLRNSIGAQSIDLYRNWTRLNNAVLVFDMNHPLLYKFIEEFAFTFDGSKWGHNGPYLVSKVVEREEKGSKFNFTILPPMAFYPADWVQIKEFFVKPNNQFQSKWMEDKLLQLNTVSYGLHLWNKESNKFQVEEGSIIDRLISKTCIICKTIYGSIMR